LQFFFEGFEGFFDGIEGLEIFFLSSSLLLDILELEVLDERFVFEGFFAAFPVFLGILLEDCFALSVVVFDFVVL